MHSRRSTPTSSTISAPTRTNVPIWRPKPRWAATVAELRAEVAARWDLADLYQRVLADQRRRRFVDRSLRIGLHTGWEYTPPRAGTAEYMRNNLDLNEVEREARWPRA